MFPSNRKKRFWKSGDFFLKSGSKIVGKEKKKKRDFKRKEEIIGAILIY